MSAQELTGKTNGNEDERFGDLEAVFEAVARKAKEVKKAEKKDKDEENDEERLAKLREQIEKKKLKRVPSKVPAKVPPKIQEIKSGEPVKVKEKEKGDLKVDLNGGEEQWEYGQTFRPTDSKIIYSKGDHPPEVIKFRPEKTPVPIIKKGIDIVDTPEYQKFVAEWSKEIPKIQAFIEELNSTIKKFKGAKNHERLIESLRFYESGLKRIILKCSNPHLLISPNDTDYWKRFSEQKGQMYARWEELLGLIESQNKVEEPVPEKEPLKPEVIPPTPTPNAQEKFIEEWKEKIPAVKDVILRIDTILPQLHVLVTSENQEVTREGLLKYKQAFEKIVDKFNGVTGAEEVTESDVKMWSDFIKPGNRLYTTMLALERELEELQKQKPEVPKSVEQQKDEEKEVKPDPMSKVEVVSEKSETEPEPEVLPKPALALSPFIEGKLTESGLTLEDLATIPEFSDIANSEGKIFWMLERFNQVKLRRIKNDATEEFEKENREMRNRGAFAKKIWRNIRRGSLVEIKAQENARKDFNFEKYRNDVEGLVHLASASPEMVLKKKGGEASVVTQYLEGVRGINDGRFSRFNESATAFANIPPKYEWKKVSKKDRAEYERIEKEYQTSRDALFSSIPRHLKTVEGGIKGDKTDFYSSEDALNILSHADFSVKMHQSINSHPTAELELKRLAETNGWNRKWDIVKAQLGIAGGAGIAGSTLGFSAGAAAIRWGTRSSLILTGAAMAAPLVLAGSALGLGGAIGWKRGEIKAKKHIIKEEELMRLGMEENKSRKGGTELNFISAVSSASKILELRNLLDMEYSEYIQTRRGLDAVRSPISLTEFEARKEEWAEKLQVRIEYTKKKIDEGKISFGKEEDALANRFHLLQEMGNAKAELALFTGHEGVKEELVGKFGKTRRGSLENKLLRAEMKIEKNRGAYIDKQKRMGLITGIAFAGIGFGAGRLISEHIFGSQVAHAVENKIQAVKSAQFTEGKMLEKALRETVKMNIAHPEMQELIKETPPTVPEVTERAFQYYPPTDLDGRQLNLPLDKPIPSLEPSGSISENVPLNPISTPESFGKPFEVSLTNEVQSREYALKQFFMHKGMSSAEAGKKASQTIRDLVKDIPGSKGERSLPFVHKGDKVMIFEKDGKVNVDVIPRSRVVEQLPKIKVEESVVIKDGQQDIFTGKRIGGDSAERAVTRVLRTNAQEFGFKGDIENKVEVRKWADSVTKEVLRQNPKMANIVTNNGDKLELVHTPNGKWFAEVERGVVVPNNNVVAPAPKEFFDKAEPAISLESSKAIPETPVVIPETPEAIPEIKDIAPDLGEEGDLFLNEKPVASVTEAFVPQEINGVNGFSNAIEKTFASDPRFASLQPRDQDKFLFKALMHVMDRAQKEGNIREFFSDMGIKSGNPFNIKNDSIDVSKVFDKPTLDRIYSDIAEGKVSDKVVGFEGRISNRLASLKNMSPEKLGGEIKKLKAYLWYKGIK